MNNDYANVIKSIKMTCNSKQAENIERQQLSFTKEQVENAGFYELVLILASQILCKI